MEYHFYLGESEERERLIGGSGSLPAYQERVTRIYTTFREKEIEIVRSLGKWLVLGPYDGSLLRYLNRNPVLKIVEEIENKIWEPTTYTDENSWSCFMVDKGEIVGFYVGNLEEDSLGRKYSTNSFVSIRPDYRGRGLCKELARFTYDNLTKQVAYIVTKVDSNIGASASRSYMRAAKDLGLNTFAYCSDQKDDDYTLREVEDCDQGKNRFSLPSYLDHLIFSRVNLDEEMIASSL